MELANKKKCLDPNNCFVALSNSTTFSYVLTPRYKHSYPKGSSVEIRKPTSLADLSRTSFTVRAVYFVNTKIHGNFGEWMDYQLSSSVFPKVDELYIVATSDNCDTDDKLLRAVSQVRSNRLDIRIELECHHDQEETYEYHGINKVWKLGQEHAGSNDIAIYFHSKGLTHAKSYRKYRRSSWKKDSQLMERVFGPMEKVLEAFALFPEVDKAGARCSPATFVWFNFMYIRGSYLNKLEKPIMTDRRHYYEDWSCRWNGAPNINPGGNEERDMSSYPIREIQRQHQCYTLDGDFYKKDANLPNIGVSWHPK